MSSSSNQDSVVSTPCPQCQKEARILQIVEDIPLFGKMILQTVICPHCGFKFSDVMSLEFNAPMGFEAKIKHEKDLSTKIIRNSSGTVEIPELGFLMEPGLVSEGFFSNIESLLERVEMVLNIFIREGTPAEKKEAQARLKLVEKCRGVEMPFTVRILDPFGGSALLGAHVRKWALSEKEAEGLKRGLAVQ